MGGLFVATFLTLLFLLRALRLWFRRSLGTAEGRTTTDELARRWRAAWRYAATAATGGVNKGPSGTARSDRRAARYNRAPAAITFARRACQNAARSRALIWWPE